MDRILLRSFSSGYTFQPREPRKLRFVKAPKQRLADNYKSCTILWLCELPS